MSLTITISGVYLDPEAQPLPGISLVFKTAYNTTQTQLQTEVKTVTADDASYSIDLVPNVYSVSEVSDGRKKWLGNIQIFADSPPGTLNEYLTSFQADQMRPGILAEMEEILEETKEVAAAAGVVPCGAFDPTTTYSANDLVEFDGSEYRATAEITGTAPPAAPWELFVSAGEQGETGPANTLTVGTVTTLAPGEPATAEITGDAPNQTLNLSIPQGEAGQDADISVPALNEPGASGLFMYYTDSWDRLSPGMQTTAKALHYSGAQDYQDTELLIVAGDSPPGGTWELRGAMMNESYGGHSLTLWTRVDTVSRLASSAENLRTIVRNMKYSSADNSTVDCELYFKGAWRPFTAHPDDPMWWGRSILTAALAGELGNVAPYQE